MPASSGSATNQQDDHHLPIDPKALALALKAADINALRVALYQATGDQELKRMTVDHVPIRGGALTALTLSSDDRKIVERKLIDYLCSNSDRNGAAVPPPSLEFAAELMEMFEGKSLDTRERELGYAELAFGGKLRDVTWRGEPPRQRLAKFKVAVIGAGMSGIASAILLKRLGIDFTIFDRQVSIGGVWSRNEYPGVRVDTHSYLYQYSFEQNYAWREYFAAGGDVRAHIQQAAARFGVDGNIEYSTEIVSADWDESSATWTLQTRDEQGLENTVEVQAIIAATGLFNSPNKPSIKGISEFEGPILYTTEWDHSVDYQGKRVALLGTGSTGVQVAPVLAASVRELAVFQRTPNWMAAIEGYNNPITPDDRLLLDLAPYYRNWVRYAAFVSHQGLQVLQYHDPAWKAAGGIVSEKNDAYRESLVQYIKERVGSKKPELVEKLTPDYAPLIRRLVVDNGFYDTLAEDHVHLVCDPVERITPKGIVTRDGVEREFDVIVFAAGFDVTKYLWPMQLHGRGGVSLEDSWAKDGPRAYLGHTMPDFPNFFMAYGPGGQPRAGGLFTWAESWARYNVGLIAAMLEAGRSSISVKRSRFDKYNYDFDKETKRLLWEDAGAGYFVNDQGRSFVNAPWLVHNHYAMICKPDLDDYEMM